MAKEKCIRLMLYDLVISCGKEKIVLKQLMSRERMLKINKKINEWNKKNDYSTIVSQLTVYPSFWRSK